MEENQEKMFKTANDLKVTVAKSNGEVVIDEECCTMVSIILKNTGDIAASFFGAHNPEVVRVLEKSLKGYFKGIKKELKKNYYDNTDEEVKVLTDNIPENDRWFGQPVPDFDPANKPATTTAAKVSPATKKPKEKKTENTKSTTKKTTKKEDTIK